MTVYAVPVLVMVSGLVAGALIAFFIARRASQSSHVNTEGISTDLEYAREAVLEALKALEMERSKLREEDYLRERQALLGHGAEAMRRLDEPILDALLPSIKSDTAEDSLTDDEVTLDTPTAPPHSLLAALNAQRESLGEERYQAALKVIQGSPDKPSASPSTFRLSPRWEGALWALGSMAIILILAGILSVTVQPKVNNSMGVNAPRASNGANPPALSEAERDHLEQQRKAMAEELNRVEAEWKAKLEANPNDIPAR